MSASNSERTDAAVLSRTLIAWSAPLSRAIFRETGRLRHVRADAVDPAGDLMTWGHRKRHGEPGVEVAVEHLFVDSLGADFGVPGRAGRD
ncbi:hypothetical protein A5724_18185 [Mycobacterium sp. ACS1612]|nr:hypothetical protein A5724_18185 [Mycobacterium sp. ACS1612]